MISASIRIKMKRSNTARESVGMHLFSYFGGKNINSKNKGCFDLVKGKVKSTTEF